MNETKVSKVIFELTPIPRKREHHDFQYAVVQYFAEKKYISLSLCSKLLFEIEISYNVLSLSDSTGTNTFSGLRSISVWAEWK